MDRPEGAEFVGYIVQHPNEEEFLAGVRAPEHGAQLYAWTLDPGLAMTFADKARADSYALAYDLRTQIAELWETDTQFWVGPIE